MTSQINDTAGSKNITVYRKLLSFLYLKYHKVKFGKNTFVKRNFEIRKSQNSEIVIGSNCMIQEYVFFLLTMPKPKLSIGNNVSIGRNTIIAIKDHLTIGDNSEISANVFICDQSHGIKRGQLINNQHSIIEKVSIGKDCWIGTNVVILKGVKIGDGSVIGASSVVNKNIPPNEIWGGNPIKFIRYR